MLPPILVAKNVNILNFFSSSNKIPEKLPKDIIIENKINIKPVNPLEDIRESGTFGIQYVALSRIRILMLYIKEIESTFFQFD